MIFKYLGSNCFYRQISFMSSEKCNFNAISRATQMIKSPPRILQDSTMDRLMNTKCSHMEVTRSTWNSYYVNKWLSDRVVMVLISFVSLGYSMKPTKVFCSYIPANNSDSQCLALLLYSSDAQFAFSSVYSNIPWLSTIQCCHQPTILITETQKLNQNF